MAATSAAVANLSSNNMTITTTPSEANKIPPSTSAIPLVTPPDSPTSMPKSLHLAPAPRNLDPTVPSRFEAMCHPREPEMTDRVDKYFLSQWPFPDERSRVKFVAAGFSRVTCFYFPQSKDDRIEHACKLLTVLFLVDDYLEHLSLSDGREYNAKLMAIVRGQAPADQTDVAQRIMTEIWEAMRACDAPRANLIVEPLQEFMTAQTDDRRLSVRGLGNYLRYREGDVGQALLATLMAFCIGFTVSAGARAVAAPVERNCGRHLSIVNDIYSYPKELAAAKELHSEGGALCNAVAIMRDDACLSEAGAVDALWSCVRGWEVRHMELMAELQPTLDDFTAGGQWVSSPSLGIRVEQTSTPELASIWDYVRGFEYQMSGNEAWSRATKRYHAAA